MKCQRLYRICKVILVRRLLRAGHETWTQQCRRKSKSYIKNLRKGILENDNLKIDSNIMCLMAYVASRDVTTEEFLKVFDFSDEELMHITCSKTVGDSIAFLNERIIKVQSNGDYKLHFSNPYGWLLR